MGVNTKYDLTVQMTTGSFSGNFRPDIHEKTAIFAVNIFSQLCHNPKVHVSIG